MARVGRCYSVPAGDLLPPSKQRLIPSNAYLPKGFLFGSAHAGVKPSNASSDDIAVVHSLYPCSATSVFTQNRFLAAPVTVSRDILDRRKGAGIGGIVINSGCANAVTGAGGIEDAKAMALELDRAMRQQGLVSDISAAAETAELSSLVMSTGVIGQRLPMARIMPAITAASAATGGTFEALSRVARAICTTDSFPKIASKQFALPSFPGVQFSICGAAKGAGMIHPNMATLLGLMCTDAPVEPSVLSSVLKAAVGRSFNNISVDGDTSTNDTVALLANGAAADASPLYKSAPRKITDIHSTDASALAEAVTDVAVQLAQLIVRDAEGATKFVTIRVRGVTNHDVGRRIASTVACSPLVKTALYGKDANWGRILMAMGNSKDIPHGVIEPSKISVSFVRDEPREELALFVNGEPFPGGVDEHKASRMLQDENVEILIQLGTPTEEDVVFWTSDLSHEYVTINGDYRT